MLEETENDFGKSLISLKKQHSNLQEWDFAFEITLKSETISNSWTRDVASLI